MNFNLKYICYAKCRRSTIGLEPGVKLTLLNITVTNLSYRTIAYYKRSIKSVMQICNAM